MLERKFAKLGLRDFDYKKTAWYQTIVTENRSYRYNLAFFSLVMLAGLCALATVVARLELRYQIVPVYACLALLFTAVLGTLINLRHPRLVINLILTISLTGLCYSLVFSEIRGVALALLLVYPVLCIQLRGCKKGLFWFTSGIALFSVLLILQFAGIVPPNNHPLSILDILMFTAAMILLFTLAWLGEKRQETLIGRLTDLLVFDTETGLPDRDVLLHSIKRDRQYIFAIIKIENFSDLVALFGYELSGTISQFASRKLVKHEHKFGYRTFQLKYNEYGILLETEHPIWIEESAKKLTTIISVLETESLPWERDQIRLVYRVGGTIITPGDENIPLSRADYALKKAERSHTVLSMFDGDTTEKACAYDNVIKFTELINNRQDDTFCAVFQPVFDRNGASIAWYEALLRVKRQNGEYVSVYPYLDIARSTGVYPNLTNFIIEQAVLMILQFDVDISVNISIQDILRTEFITLIDSVHERIKHKNGRIIFEILESDELVELEKCISFIEYVSLYGFKIAVDDFGTGYSNYGTLINLPIDIVKIDGSLIRRVKHDDNARTLVEGIVHFCKKSNKKTVAEFVENEQVFNCVQNLNIDYLQGFFLAVPDAIPKSEVTVKSTP